MKLVKWDCYWKGKKMDCHNYIECKHISKIYSEKNGKVEGIKDATFTLKRGETVGLIGANGAGKSTLIKLLIGIMRPDCGEIYIEGNKSSYFKRKSPYLDLGYSPETFYFVSKLTGWEYIEFLSAVYKKGIRENGGISLIDITKRLKLYDDLGKLLTKYSQGMLRKLSICIAIYFGKKLVVLDEPTNGLDPDSYMALRDILNDIKGGDRTILISTHQMAFVDEVCSRLMICKQGELICPSKGNLSAEQIYTQIISEGRDSYI